MTTKNGDMPAMPFEAVMARSNGNTTAWTNYTGLTKREMMAMHIMTGLCSKYGAAFDTDTVQDAIRMTDFLLTELERTK